MSNFDPKSNSYTSENNLQDTQDPIEVRAVRSVYTQTPLEPKEIPAQNSTEYISDDYSPVSRPEQPMRRSFVHPEPVNIPSPANQRAESEMINSQNVNNQNQTPRYRPGTSTLKIDYLKYLSLIVIPVVVAIALYLNNLIGLLIFWVASLVGIKLKPNLAWVIVLINALFLVLNFPIGNYLVIAAIVLTFLSALFLGLKPNISKFNKFATVAIALIVGLWVAVPMSQLGTLKYLQQEYTSNSLFQNVVNSLYIGAGSPKLSAAEIETSFKTQISTEIANSIKDKTKLIPSEVSKVTELCQQLGADKALNQNCQTLDKNNLDKSIDSTVATQVDSQTKDLKNQFNQYPQVQMVEHFLNGLGGSSKSGFWASPYFVPSVVLFLIYSFLSGLLQLISWPILLLLKRISLN